ncbi:MAG TPA: glycogen/starch/alpha-glucan phosphorylase [Polyangiaceae bacterium]|nr:glycogen/starch/alpha-glucan phosphorylase [Polyangiaceae bacterium]
MSKSERPSPSVYPPLDLKAAHLGTGVEAIKRDFLANLYTRLGKFQAVSTRNDYYRALAYTVRDRLLERWINTAQTYFQNASRTVAYLSAEFLIGPQLASNLLYLGMYEDARKAMDSLGLDFEELIEHEEEPGLGNGGLGRLAACYMDSLATLQIPAIGYGIRYEFGIFDQQIRDGWQHEVTDKWLRLGNPWEIPRYEIEHMVKLGGTTEGYTDARGRYRVRWLPERVVKGHCYDTPLLGYGVKNANMLRLWEATACESFDFQAFNVGDYLRAVQEKVVSENLTKVLYPNDEPEAGKILRLEQQYFFVSCSLQDMIRIYLQRAKTIHHFYEKYAIQLNDTHPALAIPELMRLLVDEYDLDWEEAWEITTRSFGYTNHTLLPEALECWSLPLFRRVLPRHLEIVSEINRRFLDEARFRLRDEKRLARLSLIDEEGEKKVRMANLACVGSHAINGVAALHTELLKETVLADFYALWPEKFSNKTNGVTPRRFLLLANPPLGKLISKAIGEAWPRELSHLAELAPLVEDAGFRADWQRAKHTNKIALANHLRKVHGTSIDPDTLFDVQVKRIHEYKRQHLNVLHVISLYQRIKAHVGPTPTPRTVFFGGKAAPGYWLAKLVIKLIHSVAEVVNHDRDTRELLKVVFVPDFNVKVAQHIYPAAELSEQISTAGKEASGTGNMKFQMNGALTIGTLDGANIEIRQEVGPENFFLFGLTAQEVMEARARGYDPHAVYSANSHLREAIDLLASGYFSRGDRTLFEPILQRMMERDDYMLMADFPSYIEAQDRVSSAYQDREYWTRMSILNTARSGKFSSDRSIHEYCEDIWRVGPVSVEVK